MHPVRKLFIALLLSWSLIVFAQETKKAPASQQPPMRINVLNVCTPTDAEQKEIAGALARVSQRAAFGRDYEVSRGHTTDDNGNGSDWVRIRREFPASIPWLAVQFSYSSDPKESQETTVFYARETKDVMQVALEDVVSAGSSPATVLAADTPVSHIRIERYGKGSLVLARCPNADQARYEPLFATASQIMAHYRVRLKARQIVPAELGRLGGNDGGHRPINVKPMRKRP